MNRFIEAIKHNVEHRVQREERHGLILSGQEVIKLKSFFDEVTNLKTQLEAEKAKVERLKLSLHWLRLCK